MKRLEIPAGGMPFTGDDLLWLADGLIEGILAVASNFLEETNTVRGILQGFNIVQQNSTVTISPGWCVLDGKLCMFPGFSGTGQLGDFELYYAPEYDPAGNDVFADSVTRDTYRIDKAAIRATSVAADNLPGIIPVFLIPDLKVKLKVENQTQTFRSTAKTKTILSRFGEVRNLNILIGSDLGTQVGNAPFTVLLCTLLPTDRPTTDTIERWVPVLKVTGEAVGYIIMYPETGQVRYIGSLPSDTAASYYVNLTWIV